MRLLKHDRLPDGGHEVTVSVGILEDLWHLYNFILPGDLVCTKTKRKVKKETTNGSHDAEVISMVLCIEAKEITFSPEEIRIRGVNKVENEHVMLEQYHTLTIHSDPPQKVKITKTEWTEVHAARLKEATASESTADTVVVLMDFGEARVLMVTSSYMFEKANVRVSIAKKRHGDGASRDKSINRFFKSLLDAALTHIDFEKVKLVLFCSPGNVKDEFLQYCKTECQRFDEGPKYAMLRSLSKIALVKVFSNTVGAVKEALRNPEVSHHIMMTKCADDLRLWDSFQHTMNTNPDLCVYTPELVYHAALSGAVKILMISDAVFRSPNPVERHFFLALSQLVRSSGSPKVSIFSSSHVTGQNLTQLGEVAAILFFPCPDLDDIEPTDDFLDSEEVTNFLINHAPVKVTA